MAATREQNSGYGEPSDDAAPLWGALVHGNGLDLRGVNYAVLALGNTTYDHFCKCGRGFDAALDRLAATRFFPASIVTWTTVHRRRIGWTVCWPIL